MSKVTFFGLPAWVGAVHGPTICDWWGADPVQLDRDGSLLDTADPANPLSCWVSAISGSTAVVAQAKQP